jgi:dynein heavy chain 1, cytosolic
LSSVWDDKKPIHGDIIPSNALQLLNCLGNEFKAIEVTANDLLKANQVLIMPNISKSRLTNMIEELNDLHAVWLALNGIWLRFEDVKATKWASDSCLGVKAGLDALLLDMSRMSNKVRQYEPFENVHDKIQSEMKMHVKLLVLKSDALRRRHWTKVLGLLGFGNVPLESLSVGQLWTCKELHGNWRNIDEIVAGAQGILT